MWVTWNLFLFLPLGAVLRDHSLFAAPRLVPLSLIQGKQPHFSVVAEAMRGCPPIALDRENSRAGRQTCTDVRS